MKVKCTDTLAMVECKCRDPEIRCIVFEGTERHPLIAEELMMPILGMVRVKSFPKVETAVWLEHGNRHSAHIHSKNVDHITTYARALDTAILVKKNGPSYAALGFSGEGCCAFTIASRTGRRFNSCTQLYKEQTLYNVRQPLHQIREGENKNGSKRAGC